MDPFDFWRPLIEAARANLTKLRFPDDISPAWIQGHLTGMRCSPNYPQIVGHNVMVARDMCVVGCLFYELFTTSVQYSAAALEAALKDKFVDVLPLPCRLRRSEGGRIVDEQVWTTRPEVYQLIHATGEGWKLPPPFGGFKATLGYLIGWAVLRGLIPPGQESWFRHRLRLRNDIAHGHNMVVAPIFALGTLRQTTVTLNQLYPDAETSARDEQMQREREAQLREWWLEIDDMLRSRDNLGGADSDTDGDADR